MIEVLKQMVEALEWCHGGEPVGTAEAIQAGKKLIAELESQDHIEQRLEMVEQEPVATLEELEQEIYENTRQFVSRRVMDWIIKRYYTRPQPKQKPLTDEEIDDLSRMMVKGNKSVNWLARTIEVAHGIKDEA